MVRLGIVIFLLIECVAYSKPKGFYLERLPRGKTVTLPLPATVFVSLKNRVSLRATDKAQLVKLSPATINSAKVEPIRLAIYDRHSDRVRYVDLKPGLPFLYNFKGLDKISLIPDKVGKKVDRNMRLRIESNKPLEVGR